MKSTIKKISKNKALESMKKLLIIVICALSINQISAQSDFYTSIENNDLTTQSLNNRASLKSVIKTINKEMLENSQFSQQIINFQRKIRAYDIKKSSVYDNSESARYDVSFKDENSKAHVVYNNDGDIIKSTEVYKNATLPLRLRVKIMGDNPMFEITSNKVTISYHKFFDVFVIYKVVLHNGKKRKTLKFNEHYKAI